MANSGAQDGDRANSRSNIRPEMPPPRGDERSRTAPGAKRERCDVTESRADTGGGVRIHDSFATTRPVVADTLVPLPRSWSALASMSNQKAAPRLTAKAVMVRPMVADPASQ